MLMHVHVHLYMQIFFSKCNCRCPVGTCICICLFLCRLKPTQWTLKLHHSHGRPTRELAGFFGRNVPRHGVVSGCVSPGELTGDHPKNWQAAMSRGRVVTRLKGRRRHRLVDQLRTPRNWRSRNIYITQGVHERHRQTGADSGDSRASNPRTGGRKPKNPAKTVIPEPDRRTGKVRGSVLHPWRTKEQSPTEDDVTC